MNQREQQIQRLIDGELDRQQIQQLLATADRDQELWKDIAAAFVEEQIWNSEIPASAASQNNLIESAPAAFATQSPRGSSLPFWASLAAALLIGVTVGNLLDWKIVGSGISDSKTVIAANQDQTDKASGLANDDTENENKADPIQKVDQTFLKPAHHLLIGDSGQVPLYTLDQARKMGMFDETNPIPQETIDNYRKQGYELEQKTQFVSGRTADGHGVVVPIRSFRMNLGN